MTMRKALSGFEVKDADEGVVEAVFSTFDVVDSDGDITRKGAFDDGAPVLISAYGHTSWQGALPVGKGTIHERGDHAVMSGQFWLDTTQGKDTFAAVKRAEDLQEWSYSLHDVKWSMEEVDGRKVRILEKIRVKEVSPVLMGAGVNTRTLDVKSGMRFTEHADAVLADVDELVARAQEVMALRAEKGKGLAEPSAELLERVTASMKRLEGLLTAPDPEHDATGEVAREYARFVALTTQGA